jgi:alkylation response protein AidB-like acyl-CoA dehydrogenase
MDLSFDAGLDDFRKEVRSFLAEQWVGSPAREGESRTDREKRFRLLAVDRGYVYRNVPRAYGGSEQEPDALKAEVIRQEFARVRAPMEARTGPGVSLLTPTLLEWGTEWQKQKFIPPTLRGEMAWCQGYSEPNAGSDLASLRTKGELIGDEWVINGQKIWTSNAFNADYIFILVRTEPDAPKHQGISYLIMNMRQPGISVRPLKQISGKSEFAEVFFDNAKTPADWIVGERGKGWTVSKTTLKFERSSVTGLNFQEARFRELIRLAKETLRNGKPAIEDPEIRQRLAMLEGSIASMRYSAYRQFSMELNKEDPGIFPLLRKLYSSNLAAEQVRLARDLIQDDFLIMPEKEEDRASGNSKWVQLYFSSLIMAIAGGASNIQRNIIAERGLGLPRDRVGS